jgi:23S rRNA (adenine2503-C2)-methyltransferase
MYRRGKLVEDFESMEDVSQKFRDTLGSIATVEGDLEMESIKTATDGTRKVLYRLKNGGGVVESVIIPSNTGPDGRTTVCVSSQLGCAMNCQFCFTAKMGLRKNLTAAQIVEQVVHARRLTGGGRGADVRQREETTNVVFMGMGEPLHNVDAVLTAVDVLTDPRGLAFSRNKVTVSTSGLVPEIERYLKESSGSLAVSLNATTDEIRSWIMPINRKYNLERLLGTLRENFPRQGAGRHQRHVFFEYILLAGINDSDEDAERLLEISRSMPSKFNLIYFNTHEGSEFRCSDEATIKAFRQKLVDGGAMATIRASRGDEEMAACGQLGSPDAPEDWKPAPPKLPKPRRLR